MSRSSRIFDCLFMSDDLFIRNTHFHESFFIHVTFRIVISRIRYFFVFIMFFKITIILIRSFLVIVLLISSIMVISCSFISCSIINLCSLVLSHDLNQPFLLSFCSYIISSAHDKRQKERHFWLMKPSFCLLLIHTLKINAAVYSAAWASVCSGCLFQCASKLGLQI